DARVVHVVASAAVQLRGHPDGAQPAAAVGSQAPRRSRLGERMSASAPQPATSAADWKLPPHDHVGMICLIIAEASMFTIFVVAYLFYIGKSTQGPTPRAALSTPVLGTVCLLSSSVTLALAIRALVRRRMRAFTAALGTTIALGVIFLAGTAREWTRLVRDEGLTPATNLF